MNKHPYLPTALVDVYFFENEQRQSFFTMLVHKQSRIVVRSGLRQNENFDGQNIETAIEHYKILGFNYEIL